MHCSVTLTQLVEVILAQTGNLSEAALTQVSRGIQTDSRTIKRGEVFLALRGDKFDGHEFVPTAIAKGAIAAIVDFQYENPAFPILQVKDTLKAYQQIGRWWRDRFNIPVIGV
ncbi:MAG: Mur ligase domain-containing protein, partial [Nostoc sp.]